MKLAAVALSCAGAVFGAGRGRFTRGRGSEADPARSRTVRDAIPAQPLSRTPLGGREHEAGPRGRARSSCSSVCVRNGAFCLDGVLLPIRESSPSRRSMPRQPADRVLSLEAQQRRTRPFRRRSMALVRFSSHHLRTALGLLSAHRLWRGSTCRRRLPRGLSAEHGRASRGALCALESSAMSNRSIHPSLRARRRLLRHVHPGSRGGGLLRGLQHDHRATCCERVRLVLR